MRKTFLWIVLLIASTVAKAHASELRGVWLTNVDSPVMYSAPTLKGSFEKLEALNFNVVYPVVYNKGHTLYPSQVMQRVTGHKVYPHLGLMFRDVMAEMQVLGPKHRLRVIPWFEYGLMAPASSQLAKRNPHWLAKKANGQTIENPKSWAPMVWLNPMHPEVQQFFVDLVVELMSRYDVEGLQIDDHFGLPVDYGYDDVTRALYRAEHNGAEPPANEKDPQWIRWRASKITQLAKKIASIVKQKPGARFSVSPNPYSFAYHHYLQDWKTWYKLGFVDEVIVQVYRKDLPSFEAELSKDEIAEANNSIVMAAGISTGTRFTPASIWLVSEQVKIARSRDLGGVAMFFYESLLNIGSEGPATRAAAWRRLFPTPVSAP